MGEEIVENSNQKTNRILFVVTIVSLIAGMIALAILFMPIAIISGAWLYGNGDKKGLVGIIGGIVGLLLWWLVVNRSGF